MSRGCGPFVALYTAVSVCGLAWRWLNLHHLEERPGNGNVKPVGILGSVFESSISTAFLMNLVVNFLILAFLFTKVLFFGQLSLLEIQKLVERLMNYCILKGLFLAFIAQPNVMQVALWLFWFSVLGFLKVFQGLAKDRLDRLNASPAATLFAHGRVFTVLVLVLLSSLFWIQLCIFMFKDSDINTLLLLLFEPLSMALDTLKAVLVHGMQLYDTWRRDIIDEEPPCGKVKPSERSAAAAALEWRGSLVRNFGFVMDIVSYLLSLSHCLHIWWLRGLAFKVVDGLLFLNLRTLLSAILKRIKGYMKIRTAMSTLQGALPDATEEELLAYDDDCAICKEPMARAKRLPCTHMFHLPCLKSWLDQGLAEAYSCPTCRRPLFMGSAKKSLETRHHLGDQTRRPDQSLESTGAEESRGQITFPQRTSSNLITRGPFTTQRWDPAFQQAWIETEPDFPWGNTFHSRTLDRDGSSSAAPGQTQTVVEHLTRAGRSHSQNESSETSWGWWPFPHRMGEITPSQLGTGDNGPRIPGSYYQSGRPHNRSQDFVLAPGMRAMVNTVREVLPDVSEDVIIQDLRRTNSVTTTVNNLL